MTNEQYIEHEVKLRLNDERFKFLERDMSELKQSMSESFHHLDNKIDSQFKWVIGMFISSMVLPVILHFVKAI